MKVFRNLKVGNKLFLLNLGKDWNNMFTKIIYKFKDIKEIKVTEINKFENYISIIFDNDMHISVYNNPNDSKYSNASNYIIDNNKNYIIVNFILDKYIKKFKNDIYNIEQLILDCESIKLKLESNPE